MELSTAYLSFLDISSAFVFGGPTSYIHYPEIPKFTGEELSICFVMETTDQRQQQTIFRLFDSHQCQLVTSLIIANQKIYVRQHRYGGTTTVENGLSIFKNLPTPICYRWLLKDNQMMWQVSVRGSLVMTGPSVMNPSPMPLKLALMFGDVKLDQTQEDCKVIPSTEHLFEGRLFYIMVYTSFISDDAVRADFSSNWFVDESLQLTTGNFENYTQGAVSIGKIFG